MRYFFVFKTNTRSNKFDNRELFYVRLLNKRMGKNYKIHGYCEYKIPDCSDYLRIDHFNGYVIEFDNEAAFVKFKLGFKKLFNPNLNVKNHVYSVKSFAIDDDFIENYKKCCSILDDDMERYRSYATFMQTVNLLSELCGNIKIFKNGYNTIKNIDDDVNDEIVEHYERMKQKIEEIDINFDFHEYNKFYGMLSDTRQRHSENIEKMFINFQDHTF